MRRYGGKRYVPVAERQRRAGKKMESLKKKGVKVQPVLIEGHTIAKSFWGKSWCRHLDSFSDYANRLPRGRSYVRNGSVCHLEIKKGAVKAMVSGTRLYTVTVSIKPLAHKKWDKLKSDCVGQIGSLIDLLQGKLSEGIMGIVTHPQKGLFPLSREIHYDCSCPDWAAMCKHVSAVFYGIGARLDREPELLFLLRGVDHNELISVDMEKAIARKKTGSSKRLSTDSLSDIFGVELEDQGSTEDRAFGREESVDVKRPTSGRMGAIPGRKTRKRSTKKKAKKEASFPLGASPTGRTIAALRKKFGMTKTAFAKLVGVSTATITTWENTSGRLKTQPSKLAAIQEVAKLTKKQAQERA